MSAVRQESIPDPPGSEPAQLIDSGALYQPAPFGERLGVATVTGALVSYRTTKLSDEVFPARSVQLPPTDVLLVSGPPYATGEWHDAIPEVPSVPLQAIERGALNQPFAFGAGVDAACVTGGVVSYFTRKVAGALFPALSVQLPVLSAPVVSGPLYAMEGLQEARPEIGSAPLQSIESGALNQPSALGERLGVTTVVGGESSYENCNVPGALLPAWSVQLPEALAVRLSGPV